MSFSIGAYVYWRIRMVKYYFLTYKVHHFFFIFTDDIEE